MYTAPELVCPAGNLPALKVAVDHGADTVYMGLKDITNARNFAGLNFDFKSATEGIAYAHKKNCKVLMAINTYAQAGLTHQWHKAIDTASELGVDAVILADLGMLAYAHQTHPHLRLHLSVQGSATNYEAINLAYELFGIQRVVLPRVLTLEQVKQVTKHTDVEVEVFGFGSLCVMVEGRCLLSSYVTGESPNTHGVCSPAKFVRWEQTPQLMRSRLNNILIDQYGSEEPAGYPTICKGRFMVQDETYYALEEPTSLNVIDVLPELIKMKVSAIKVEGRQRSPAYTAQVTQVLREAIDLAVKDPDGFKTSTKWHQVLAKVSEGQQATLGAYSRPWK
ncbi:ubiquinone anaerobic biosynthesis protein UbiU [Neisseria sp. Ec49-e6-T10]|uniref:ubiquinone anaerobic biosynthesis protein UbiU n=1 Tax=Neisseria sp. Ec49-e6-T10 TaxID=3140744 RepID=UPI003EBC00A0